MSELNLYIYGVIGSSMFEEGFTAKAMAEQVNRSKDESIVLHINSPGGSVYEGYAIYNILKNSGKKITAIIEGNCASIATLIALAADTIEMLPLSKWLIHNPFAGLEGDAEELRRAADELEKIEGTLVSVYSLRTGKSAEEIKALMKQDRWMDASEAKSFGFIDSVKEPLKAVAFWKATSNNNKMDIEKINNKLSGIEKLLNKFFKPKNEAITTADGTEIMVDPELKEGATVTISEIAAPDGDLTLEDGTIITIAGGLITKITAPSEGGSDEELSKENAALKAKIAELEASNTSANATIAALNASQAEAHAAILELKAEFVAVKAMTVGAQVKIKTGEQVIAKDKPAASVWDEVLINAKK